MKLTPLRELGRNQCSTPVVAVGLGVGGSSTSATENKENRRNRGRQIRRKASLSKFPGMTSMKSALFNIGQVRLSAYSDTPLPTHSLSH